MNRTLKQSNGQGNVRDFWAEFIVTQTYANEEGDDRPYGCLVQTGYLMSAIAGGGVLMTPSARSLPNAEVNYGNCTGGRTDKLPDKLHLPDSFNTHSFFSCAKGNNGTGRKVCTLTLEDRCSEVHLAVPDISEDPFEPEHHEQPKWYQTMYEEWGAHIIGFAVLSVLCCLCCCCACWRERIVLKGKSRHFKSCCAAIEGCLECRKCRRRTEYDDPFLL